MSENGFQTKVLESLARLEARLANVEAHLSKLNGRVGRSEQAIAVLQASDDRRDDDSDSGARNIAALQSRVAMMSLHEGEVAKLKEQLGMANMRVTALERQRDEIRAEYAGAKWVLLGLVTIAGSIWALVRELIPHFKK